METSINSKHGEVSWASLFRPTINKAERNISTKKARKGFRGKSRKSYSWNQSEHENFRGSQSSINSLEISPRSPHSPMEQIMQADPAITKKILKLSDVQINQKLELNRPGKIFPDKKDSEMSKSTFDFMDSIVIGDNVMLVT